MEDEGEKKKRVELNNLQSIFTRFYIAEERENEKKKKRGEEQKEKVNKYQRRRGEKIPGELRVNFDETVIKRYTSHNGKDSF